MFSIKSIVAASGVMFALNAFAAPSLVNGSLTGTIATNGVPSGWSILEGSPDTMDQSNNVGVPGSTSTPFAVTPTASTDKGTWVGIGSDVGFTERFAQRVGGFTIGASYQLSWEHANFGVDVLGYTGVNAIEVLIDGASIGIGALLELDRSWHDESIMFTAAADTLEIAFQLANSTKSYHSIDGIKLSEASAVPEPTSVALLAAGLLAVGMSRRRKV